MQCQYEGGLRQRDSLFPDLIKLNGNPNGLETHQRTRSAPSTLSYTMGNGGPRNFLDLTAPSDDPLREVRLISSDIMSLLAPAPSNYSTQIDAPIQTCEDHFKQSPGTETPTRVPSPIEPFLMPRPASIPPHSKQNITISDPEVPHILLGTRISTNVSPMTKLKTLSEDHKHPQRLESILNDQIGHQDDDSSFDSEWQRIQQLRIDTWSLRSTIHQMRASLREKQHVKSVADDRLLQRIAIEEFRISSRKADISETEKTLTELRNDCRGARAEYGPLEDDCNQLEDQLSEQEFELTKLEKHFYARWETSLSARQQTPGFEVLCRPSPAASMSLDIDTTTQDHPLVTEFLSRTGDLEILQERLVDLEEEKESLESERNSRQRFELSLAPDDQTWLDSAQTILDELLKKIRIADEDVNRLRQECFSRGLIDQDGEPTDFQSQERSTFSDEDVNSKDQMSEYVKHPILLPKPGTKLASSIAVGKVSNEKPVTLGQRVNQWILEQLRESALDVNLLARTFEGYGEIDDSWEVSVLAVWNADGTGNTEGHHVHTTSTSHTTTHAPLLSDRSFNSSKIISHKSLGNQAYRHITAQRLSFPPFTYQPEDMEQGTVMGKSPSLGKGTFPGKVHWSSD